MYYELLMLKLRFSKIVVFKSVVSFLFLDNQRSNLNSAFMIVCTIESIRRRFYFFLQVLLLHIRKAIQNSSFLRFFCHSKIMHQSTTGGPKSCCTKWHFDNAKHTSFYILTPIAFVVVLPPQIMTATSCAAYGSFLPQKGFSK